MKNKKNKLSLNSLNVKSFTTLSNKQVKSMKGGKITYQDTSVRAGCGGHDTLMIGC